MKKDFIFSFLTQEFQKEIVQLRHSEYKRYYGEQVNLTGLDWNKADQQSIHLGIQDTKNNSLVAYLRLTGFSSNSKLESTTLFLTPPDIQMPIALLTRAATMKTHESLGLHSILRCRALEVCLKSHVTAVLGTLEISANRFGPLKKLGYSILSTKNDWGIQSYIQSQGSVALIGLTDSEKIKNAMMLLQVKYELEPLAEKFPQLHFI